MAKKMTEEEKITEIELGRIDDLPSPPPSEVKGFFRRLHTNVELRYKFLTGLILVLLIMFGLVIYKEYTRPAALKPWAPIAQPVPGRIACLNVVVPGQCLPVEDVNVYPDGPGSLPVKAQYATMHVPLGGPFPDYIVKSERCSTDSMFVDTTAWVILAIPADGSYDQNSSRTANELPKGCTPFSIIRSIGPEQQARVKTLYAEGINTTVWQEQGTNTPEGPPPGYYAQGVNFQTDNFAIVYGG